MWNQLKFSEVLVVVVLELARHFEGAVIAPFEAIGIANCDCNLKMLELAVLNL